MPDQYRIVIRERRHMHHTAQTNEGPEEYAGDSPDEALGYAVRQLWLADELSQNPPPLLDIHIWNQEDIAEKERQHRERQEFAEFLDKLLHEKGEPNV